MSQADSTFFCPSHSGHDSVRKRFDLILERYPELNTHTYPKAEGMLIQVGIPNFSTSRVVALTGTVEERELQALGVIEEMLASSLVST